MYTFIRMIHTHIHIGQPIRLPRVDIYRNIYVRTYVHTYIHTHICKYIRIRMIHTNMYLQDGERFAHQNAEGGDRTKPSGPLSLALEER